MNSGLKSGIIKHLKSDMKTFEHEKKDDKKLIKKIMKKNKKHEKRESKKHEKLEKVERKLKKANRVKKEEEVIADDMERFAQGKLHSGSKRGPIVKNPKQAIAISLSVARKKKRK